jgi:hypothetical protein
MRLVGSGAKKEFIIIIVLYSIVASGEAVLG